MIDTPAALLARSVGLGDALAGRLASAIAAGEFPPGARLPTEKQLVEQYAVSRTVVREAIARLKTDGFVETRQGSGAFVTAKPGLASFRISAPGNPPGALGETELGHIFELRAVMEAGMAELAAQRRSESDLAAIRQAYDGMQQALAEGRDGSAADDAFHAAIAAAAHNPYLAQFAAFLAQHFSATRAVTWKAGAMQAGSARAAQAEHARLLAAIEAGAGEGAAHAARDHIRQAAARHEAARHDAARHDAVKRKD